MSAYDTRLLGHEEIAAGTRAFRLAKPPGFDFEAGQAITLVLVEPPPEENSRQRIFSLVSAPFEPELCVATRMRKGSAFKRALAALPAGAPIGLRGPRGSMTLRDDPQRPCVFIAGGIGITPFMSMLRQAAHDGSARESCLVHSNRRPEDAAFLDELQGLEARLPAFRLHATMTDMAASARAWQGDTRILGAEVIADACHGLDAPVYFVVGPPGFVGAAKHGLGVLGVPAADVRTEPFYGY
ncbi:MAG TPA: FAD-dependent oxidoreductase [Burkholderiales bacterium]|nr:FAD-dependent oxidoreductase [Burkholderiales bacterium]